MTIDEGERNRRTRRALAAGLLFSAVVHVALLATLGPLWADRDLEPLDVSPEEEERDLVVDATWEEPEKPEPDESETIQPELAEPEPLPPKPEPPKREEPEPIESQKLDRKVVEQQTNEEVPEEANYLSEQANRVSEETRARETTTDPAPRPERNEKDEEEQTDAPDEPTEIASISEPEPTPRQNEPKPRPQPRPDEAQRQVEEEAARDPVIIRERPPPRELLIPDAANYERMFADRDVAVREHSEANRPKKTLFEGYEELNGKVKASLENFIHEVRPGNHTGVNAHKSVYAGYVGKIHRKIHSRWANRYLMDLDLHEPPGSPMNAPDLNTKLEFVIRAQDGELESVNIVSGSGQTRFDAQAVTIAYAVGPHPNPPPEIVSPNGRVYIHWNFWRDQRQCGTFGASVFLVDTDEG